MELKKYRKITKTIAHQLTEADWHARNGVIHTLEGPKTFNPGDWEARDPKGTWPIKQATIEQSYQAELVPTSDGWTVFQPLDVREAAQMDHDFEADGLQGKAGGYLVRSGGREWPVDQEIFEASYELVEE